MKNESQNLEARIGMYWLNKLGVVSLVIGVVFLLLYSFQFFNAQAKLITTFAIAAALIVLGEKVAKNEKQKWYGHGLMGGGWAIAYFTVYAMYFISDLKLIYSYPAELVLLLAVCGSALFRAIRCKAEMIAIVAVTLADISICLSGPTILSNVPILLISIAVSAIALRQNWYALFIWLTAASYPAFFIASASSVDTSERSLQAIGFLFALWLTLNLSTFAAKEDTDWERNALTVANCLNVFAFLICLLIFPAYYLVVQKYLLIGAAGCYYLAVAPLLKRRNLTQLMTVNLLIGLSLVNIAKWMKSTGQPIVVLDLVEIALLATIGVKYGIRTFRWFALGLTVAFFPLWFQSWSPNVSTPYLGLQSFPFVLIGALAAGIFGTLCWLYSTKEHLAGQSEVEQRVYRNIYFVFANCAALLIPSQFKNAQWALPVYCAQAGICTYLSLKQVASFFAIVAIAVAIHSGFALLAAVPNWQWLPIMIVITMCYGFSAYCQRKSNSLPQPFCRQTMLSSAMAGSAILTILVGTKLSSFWLSTGLAVDGLVLLAVGFILKARFFRVFGLIALASLTLKLLFVDLAQANTLERIVSFIVAGVVFLTASYAYVRFTEKLSISS